MTAAKGWLDRQRVAAAAPFLPAALLFVLLLIWVAASGGYFPQAWYPSAIGAVGLLGATLSAGLGPLPRRRPARIALLAFAALVAFNYLSMLWAHSPGSAWQASNKLLLYLSVAWTIAVLPWGPRTVAVLLGAWSLGIAIVCAVGLIGALGTSHLDRYFVEFRYAEPMMYSNATAALAMMAMWPALILSARRGIPGWLQAVFLSAAVFLAEFALLPQSRAVLLGLALVTPGVLALVSDRLRLLPRIIIVGAGLALAVSRTLDVDRAVNAGYHVAHALRDAALLMLLTAAGAAIAAMLLALAERRLAPRVAARWARGGSISASSRRRGLSRSRLLAGAGALVVVVASVVAFGGGAIGHAAGAEWHKLRGDSPSGPRLFSTSPEERVDYLRVGLRLFRDAPVGGVGAGNFGLHYDALRHVDKHSQYTHNLSMRALSETGVVGLALLLTIMLALAVATINAGREQSGLGRACAVSALAVAAYFFVHDSLDWMDEFPALAVPALAFPLAASSMQLGRRSGQPPVEGRLATSWARIMRRAAPRAARRITPARRTAALGGFVVAAALVLIPPYLATRYIRRAYATYRISPGGAFRDLRRAAALNPLSIEPLTGKGTIAVELGQPQTARAAFAQALGREESWYPRLELALLDAQAGQFAPALRQLALAQALDPHDPLIGEARTRIEHHQRIDPIQFNLLSRSGPQALLFERQTIK